MLQVLSVGNQFSDHAIMPYTFRMVYWVLSMGRLHRTPHLAHVDSLSIISSSHSSFKLYCIDHLSVYS